MKVNKFPNKFDNSKKTLILGAFSSFHNGHKVLLDVAKSYKNKVMLLLFNDTKLVPGKDNSFYESLEIRLQKLANIGVDYVTVLDFDSKVKNLEGKDFLDKLIETHNVKNIVFGNDFAMGKNRSLKAIDIKNNYDGTMVKLQKVNNVKLSTSVLVDSVKVGDVSFIKKVSPFHFWAKIKVDRHKGFELIDSLKPQPGIYAGYMVQNSIKYWAIANIKMSDKHEIYVPDFQAEDVKFEAIFEFNKLVRATVKKEKEKLTKEDIEKAARFLKNNL